MQNEELIAIFDQQAPEYDRQSAKVAPILGGFYFLLEAVFADLPRDARILGVGVGTGAELAHLAKKFPRWSFTVVEPSKAMLEVCQRRAEDEEFASRCFFHEGYLDSLPIEEPHDAATCFLVSQFILNQEKRSEFFQSIAQRLCPGGILASSDLAAGSGVNDYEALLHVRMNMLSEAGTTSEKQDRMRNALANDLAILPSEDTAYIIESGGFESPVQFFQAGLLHAWYSKRAPIIAAGELRR